MTHYSMFSVWCTAMLLLAVAGANGQYVLELVQIVHRTGVTPPGADAANRTKMCSPSSPSTTSCDAVESAGVQQIAATGTYVKQLYTADTATTGASSWFTSPYSASTFRTRALGEPATVQAANALLGALYSPAAVVPAIMASDASTDTVLNADANPSIVFANEASQAAAKKQLEALVDQQFPDLAVLAAMGAEVGLDTVCSSPSSKVACCVALQELATMYAATSQTNTVTTNAAKLQTVAAAYRDAKYGYSPSVGSSSAARGSLGYALAESLLANMRGKMLAAGDAKYNSAKVAQYAHRTPIATAIGSGASGVAPVAETFIIDLLRDTATSAYFVRLRSASTTAAATAAAAVFPFRCTNAAGEHTDATTADGITCPFDDFARFVQSTRGTSAAGAACFLDEATRAEMDCQAEGEAPSDACAQYRAMCQAQACQSGTVYDTLTGNCVPLYWQRDMINSGVMGALCIAVALAGFMSAIISVEVFPIVRQRVSALKNFRERKNEPVQ